MGESDARLDAELLTAVTTGDGEAFAVFYRRYLPAIVAFLRRETGDRELAADLAAEVFAAVLLAAGRFRPDVSATAAPWVFTIARNKLADSRRRGQAEARARQRLGFEREAIDDSDLERVDELAAAGERALELLADLPMRQQAAVRRRVVDGSDYTVIAEELRCSELVVRQRVSRGLTRLRQRLTEDQP
jgi:RNA polymerase sigma-70 factor (ECF subfamily)